MTQASLFDVSQDGERLILDDAELIYFRSFYDTATADQLFESIHRDTPWRHEYIQVAGLQRLQPRLSAWYGDPEATYSYSGLSLQPLEWTPTLAQIKHDISVRAQVHVHSTFNSVLLNYYRDQHDSMGWHSDDEPELGPQPVIASLTLGCPRIFELKHKSRAKLRYQIPLEHGSVLIMAGETQRHWLHAIAKEQQFCRPRLNLTFRQIFPSISPID